MHFKNLYIRDIPARNPFVLAPMDGYSDSPFRVICMRVGAGLCFTEMIPAMALLHHAKEALRRLHISNEERPVIAQIVGSDPGAVSKAALIAQDAGADAVDINAGCPSRCITNGGAGAALLSDLTNLGRILEATRAVLRVPLTLKIRSGPTADRVVLEEVARIVSDTGVDAVTLHPRTRAQGFKGRADWRQIAFLKERVKVPVIGNGDVTSAEDAIRMLRETKCDGVMIGRAAVGNPWIFRDAVALWRGQNVPLRPDLDETISMIETHFLLLVDHLQNEKVAAKIFRKHLTRYTAGFPGCANLRRRLSEVVSKATMDEVLKELL